MNAGFKEDVYGEVDIGPSEKMYEVEPTENSHGSVLIVEKRKEQLIP